MTYAYGFYVICRTRHTPMLALMDQAMPKYVYASSNNLDSLRGTVPVTHINIGIQQCDSIAPPDHSSSCICDYKTVFECPYGSA